jgi:hypothetical protein
MTISCGMDICDTWEIREGLSNIDLVFGWKIKKTRSGKGEWKDR